MSVRDYAKSISPGTSIQAYSHCSVLAALNCVGFVDRTMSEGTLPVKRRRVLEERHLHKGNQETGLKLGQAAKWTPVREQSWDRLTDRYANLVIKALPQGKPAAINSHPREQPNETQPQRKRRVDGTIKDAPVWPTDSPTKKRRADGSIEDEQIWGTDGLITGLIQEASGRQTSKVRLHMDVDVLRRRIALIEACEQSKQQRKGSAGPEKAIYPQQANDGKCNSRTEHGMTFDWEEAVLR